MKMNQVTMVNPQQIVQKGLKGCSSTRTVTNFAQKYGIPSVWYSPTRTQRVLLVDWPTFRNTWKQYYGTTTNTTTTTRTGMTYRTTGYKDTPIRTATTRNRTWNKNTTPTYGTKSKYYGQHTTKRTRQAA
jgi:hypothetical protein